jgi:anti-anti-sigma factor
LTLEGALDAHTVPELHAFLATWSPGPRATVVIDIDRLTLIDSSGIGVLLALSKRLRAEGKSFHVVNAHDQPLLVIKLLKLEGLFGLG